MAICNFEEIDIDLKNEENIISGKCKQNDTLTFIFNVYDGGVNADLSNFSCILKANKNNEYYEIRDNGIKISNNVVTIICPNSITQIPGNLKMELMFINSLNELQKTSFDINILVKKSVLSDNEGNIGKTIITPLQSLDENLSLLTTTINDAKTINNKLTDTNNSADVLNTKLNDSINNADKGKVNLDNSINDAEEIITDLKQTNINYTNHIDNEEIHVTRNQKDKWDSYENRINQLIDIIDNFVYTDAYVVDENVNNIIDENGNKVIV